MSALDDEMAAFVPSWKKEGGLQAGAETLLKFQQGLNFPPSQVTALDNGLPQESPSIGGSFEGSAPVIPNCWKVITQPHPTIAGRYQKGVVFLSYLQNDLPILTLQPAITGLLSSENPSPTDTGWTDVLPGSFIPTDPGDCLTGSDYIWLKVTGDPVGGPTAWAIESIGGGQTFDGREVEHDGGVTVGAVTIYTQCYSRRVIARLGFKSHSPDVGLIVRQHVMTNLTMSNQPLTARDSSGNNGFVIGAIFPSDG